MHVVFEIPAMLVVRCQTQTKGLGSFWLGFFLFIFVVIVNNKIKVQIFFYSNILATVYQKGKYF